MSSKEVSAFRLPIIVWSTILTPRECEGWLVLSGRAPDRNAARQQLSALATQRPAALQKKALQAYACKDREAYAFYRSVREAVRHHQRIC